MSCTYKVSTFIIHESSLVGNIFGDITGSLYAVEIDSMKIFDIFLIIFRLTSMTNRAWVLLGRGRLGTDPPVSGNYWSSNTATQTPGWSSETPKWVSKYRHGYTSFYDDIKAFVLDTYVYNCNMVLLFIFNQVKKVFHCTLVCWPFL